MPVEAWFLCSWGFEGATEVGSEGWAKSSVLEEAGGGNGVVESSEVWSGSPGRERAPEESRSISPRVLTAVVSDLEVKGELTGGQKSVAFDRNDVDGERLARE